MLTETLHKLNELTHTENSCRNVGETERVMSLIGGGLLALHGLTRGRTSGLFWLALGAGLLFRGSTGHCQVYEALDCNTAKGTKSCSK